MNPPRWQELLVLRLYGELEPAESAELDQWLARSPDCRRYAAELEQGLGRLARTAPPPLVVSANRPRRRLGLSTALLGFAAGLLAAAAWNAATPAPAPATSATSFRRATPPPLASSTGDIARLGALLMR